MKEFGKTLKISGNIAECIAVGRNILCSVWLLRSFTTSTCTFSLPTLLFAKRSSWPLNICTMYNVQLLCYVQCCYNWHYSAIWPTHHPPKCPSKSSRQCLLCFFNDFCIFSCFIQWLWIFLIYTYWPHATWSDLSWKKHFAGVSIWSIICRRCKPCQVVLGEGGSSTYWKRGEPDNQRHLAFLSHLALGV